jgi:trk/ktr system potassium uptake protein
MKKRFVIYSIGKLLEILAWCMCIPAVIAYMDIPVKTFPGILLNPDLFGLLVAIITSVICGNILKFIGTDELTGDGIREGFAIVAFGWIFLTLFGAIPLMTYFIAQAGTITPGIVFSAFTDSYFEIMSGFTTTGATIITDIEIMPKGILFWRSLTHWLGGMGMVTLALAILPVFGIASYQMFRGEVPGPTAERLKPRLAQTAKILWGAYTVLTLAEVVLLNIGGMTVFDAFCHAFGTMATGGFSTRNASIGAYNSAYIDWVVIIFMFFAGMNFVIHYRVIFAGKFDLIRKNKEFHFYTTVIIAAVLLSTLVLSIKGIAPKEQIQRSYRDHQLTATQLESKITEETEKIKTLPDRIRHSAFQVISITTTTGFCTADFDVWPNVLRFTLVILMFCGGCAGSTGGGMKMIRVMVGTKAAWREVKTIIRPRIILPIKVADKAMEEKQVANIMGFIALFLGCFVIFSGIMSLLINDFTTAVTTVVATMCNIGPGLSGIGATQNYAWIPLSGKWILTLCMLLGRLEIYTVLIALSWLSWKK